MCNINEPRQIAPDENAILGIVNNILVEIYNNDEGLYGDYDEEDQFDLNLLRFDAYVKKEFVGPEAIPGCCEESSGFPDYYYLVDSSYCTNIPADTPVDVQRLIANGMANKLANALTSWPCSIRGLAQELSWTDEGSFQA